MKKEEIRWLQRLVNFESSVNNLSRASKKAKINGLNYLEKQGFIKSFELSFELSWKVLRDYFKWQGNPNIYGSRDAFKEAISKKIVTNGDIWMKMIESRNMSIHTYDENLIDGIIGNIPDLYLDCFNELLMSLNQFKYEIK